MLLIGCYTPTINLSVQKFVKTMDSSLVRIHTVTQFFHKSAVTTASLTICILSYSHSFAYLSIHNQNFLARLGGHICAPSSGLRFNQTYFWPDRKNWRFQLCLFVYHTKNANAKLRLGWYIDVSDTYRWIELIDITSRWLAFSICISICKNWRTWVRFEPNLLFCRLRLNNSTTRAIECLDKICQKSFRLSNCCYGDN